MFKKKNWVLVVLLLAVSLVLIACGGKKDEGKSGGSGKEDEDKFTVAMVTDVGGVDDKSFNQSAWEGLQEFGKENGMKKGDDGYDYLQSNSDQDYVPNLNTLVRRGFDLIFGIGYMLEQPISEIADQYPDVHFGIVDSVVQKDNVVSLMFKEQEVSFLAGVAAGLTTKTGKVGFVGGMESDVIKRFEAGYVAGVAAVDPNIEVMIDYVGAFNDPEGGRSIANHMYSSGADVIFHASGASGDGVFTEAKARKELDPNAEIWVIGVDSDQYAEGDVEVGGKTYNVTLTSTLKRVDVAVKDTATKAMKGEFPGGKTVTYGLADGGVELSTTGDHISEDNWKVINEWKDKIVSGDLVVPSTDDELNDYFQQMGIKK